jgi:hypothetical protein
MANVTAIRKLVDMPDSMRALPVDKRGYPVPKFVAWIDGEPDFRVIERGWFKACVEKNLCWLCGCSMGRKKWFVIGPMCCVTHASAEPPSHKLCAEFAAKNCPFLTRPLAKRRDADMPDAIEPPGGVFITRNPGVCAVWETTSYRIVGVPGNYLIHIGPASNVTFWREGRPATRTEVAEASQAGIDQLVDMAMSEDLQTGQIVAKPAMQELMKSVAYFGQLLDDAFGPTPANDDGHDDGRKPA